jgi:hypothetical protein
MTAGRGGLFPTRPPRVCVVCVITGLALGGDHDRVDAAMAFFRERGVRVEPIELDVVEG